MAVPTLLSPAVTSVELRAVGVSKAYGPLQVLDDVSLVAAPGHRLGVVGENGAGKSTLLSILSGTLEPDLGEVRRPPVTGHLHQELPVPPITSVGAVLAAALAPARALEAELAEAAERLASGDPDAPARYDAALAAAERADVWDADRRADAVLAGLRLDHVAPGRTVGSLSGGERTRLELATLLTANPDALVLDEPTNHLDDDALDFLAAHLRAFAGPIVTSSHDRLFLDDVCTGILDLDPGRAGPRTYGGSYERYLEQKGRERVRWEQQWSAEQGELSGLRDALTDVAPRVAHNRPARDNDKFIYAFKGSRVNNQISRRLRNTRERIDSLEDRQVPRPPDILRFEAPEVPGDRADERLVTAVGVTVDGRLATTDVDVDGSTRLLVSGRNGAGKSTLLAVLAGRATPTGGAVTRRRGLRIGYLPQDVVFEEGDVTARDLFASVTRAQTLTDLGLLAGRDLARPVNELSVGQRRRVALGCIVASRPHLLLMDEPTNHLSLALAEELEDALMTTLGPVVVASHDRWLRRRWNGDELKL